MAQWCLFWKTDLKNADTALRQSLASHIIMAKHAAPYMIRNHHGLIVEVTESDLFSAGGNPITQAVKLALKGSRLTGRQNCERMASLLSRLRPVFSDRG
jgi:hypothetical protein